MIMSLLQSAKLNKADPWAYLKDVLTRLPTIGRLVTTVIVKVCYRTRVSELS
jgi:hypothetical protein